MKTTWKLQDAKSQFSKVVEDLLLITIFGKDVSLGFVRLKVAEAVKNIQALIKS